MNDFVSTEESGTVDNASGTKQPYQRHIAELEHIPPEIRDKEIWCAWKLVEKPGKPKPDKVPVSPVNGFSSWRDPGFCTTAERAIHYAQGNRQLHGIGLVLGIEPALAGGDLDGCTDEQGEPNETAARIIAEADTYTELSPGLNGYRFLFYGSFGGHTGNNRAEGVELYEDKRFLTFTGNQVDGSPFCIERRDLTDLGLRYFPVKATNTATSAATPEPTGKSEFDDLTLPGHIRRWITNGIPEGKDRSTVLLGICKDLLRAGASKERALEIVSDPFHRCGAKALEERQGDIESARDWLWRYCVEPAAQQVADEPQEFDTVNSRQGADGSWPDVVALETEPPARLPVDTWPEVLRNYAIEAAAETETPQELPALMALGALSVATQRYANVQVKPGYQEPVSLFIAVAMPPGTRKSAEHKRAMKPLIQVEAKQREAFAEEIKKAESLLKTHQERVKALRKQATNETDEARAQKMAEDLAELEANEPLLPQPPRLITSDVTTEHLATMMAGNNEAMGVTSAEGGIFDTMAGRYNNQVANIDLYLQAHAGDPVRVDRGSKPEVVLNNPRLTMALAVQPDVLEQLSAKPEFKGRGLVARFMYALPPNTLGKRTGDGPRMSGFTEASYETTVKELAEASDVQEEPATVSLDDEAGTAWQAFWAEVEADLGDGGMFECCRDWAGKLPGAAARIAAQFHFARHGASGISKQVGITDMQAAIETARALSTHALAVYGLMGADADIEGAKVLLGWIQRHRLAEFTRREAHQNHKSRFPKAEEMAGPLMVLIERGYIRKKPTATEGGKKGRPSEVFEVNPSAIE